MRSLRRLRPRDGGHCLRHSFRRSGHRNSDRFDIRFLRAFGLRRIGAEHRLHAVTVHLIQLATQIGMATVNGTSSTFHDRTNRPGRLYVEAHISRFA